MRKIVVGLGTIVIASGALAFACGVDTGNKPPVDFTSSTGVNATDGGSLQTGTGLGGGGGGGGGGGTGVSTFAGGRVLLIGTLSEGACYRDVVFDPLGAVNAYSAGFDCYASSRTMRADGRIAYRLDRSESKLYLFNADAFTTDKDGYSVYPSKTEVNDTLIATPACPDKASLFGAFPDENLIVYGCSDGNRYVEGSTQPFGPSGGMVALGRGRRVLHVVGATTYIWKDGVDTPILFQGDDPDAGASYLTVTRARSRGDGFMIAGHRLSASNTEQYLVAANGTATVQGRYTLNGGYAQAMDGDGSLYGFGRDADGNDNVTRYKLDTDPEIIYTEKDPSQSLKHPVKIHISYLINAF